MQTFTFLHKIKPGVHEDIPAKNLEAARAKLSERVKDPGNYRHPTDPKEKKLHEYHKTSGNPYAEDEHSIPPEVHEARRLVA